MIGQETSQALTLAGFISLAMLGLGTIGLILSLGRRSEELRDRVTKLEETLKHHLNNGFRHKRDDEGRRL